MFIDPVVDIFVDPCDPSFRQPTARERQKFQQWTTRYIFEFPAKNWEWLLIFRFQAVFSSLPPFDCSSRCQAPDTFFSGQPWLSHPENGTLYLKFNSQQSEESFLEWQIWIAAAASENSSIDLRINGQQQHNKAADGEELGLIYRTQTKYISHKILIVKVHVKIQGKSFSLI